VQTKCGRAVRVFSIKARVLVGGEMADRASKLGKLPVVRFPDASQMPCLQLSMQHPNP
jgi:hypothetical protein